jgi:CRP-like cAMP-binding protein
VRREIRPEAFLANLPLFRGLGADPLARLTAGTTKRKLSRGETLFREDEVPTGIHALVYGRVKLSTRKADGREHVVDLVGPGQSFGEAVMFLGKPYIVTATALADSLVLHVDKHAVLAELERSPHFAASLIGTLAARIEGLVRELQDRALGTAAERFVAWLLRRRGMPPSGSVVITLPSAKRLLAARLHISAEHLSRVMHQLADDGLIRVRGRDVAIDDVDRLRAWQRESAASPRSWAQA